MLFVSWRMLFVSWQDTQNVAHFLVCPRRAGYHRVRQFGFGQTEPSRQT